MKLGTCGDCVGCAKTGGAVRLAGGGGVTCLKESLLEGVGDGACGGGTCEGGTCGDGTC